MTESTWEDPWFWGWVLTGASIMVAIGVASLRLGLPRMGMYTAGVAATVFVVLADEYLKNNIFGNGGEDGFDWGDG